MYLADLMFKGKDIKDIVTPGVENVSFISGGSGIQELTKLFSCLIHLFISSQDLFCNTLRVDLFDVIRHILSKCRIR